MADEKKNISEFIRDVISHIGKILNICRSG